VTALLPLSVVVPLIGAAICLVFSRWRAVQRIVSIGTLLGGVVMAAVILAGVESDGISAVQLGGWAAPVGISLVADLMAGLFLLVSMLTVLTVLIFAIGQDADSRQVFHPCYLVLTAGVAGSFLSGDLFNLFVCFEMMLIASYVLITLGATTEQVRSGMTYVVINLTASTLFVTAVAFVYGATGTLNFADLSVKFPQIPGNLQLAIGLTLLVVFGVKAAIFPLFGWLPDSYPTAPTSITAVFAGLLTKVGVYAIIRTHTSLGLDELGTFILVIAGLTMVIGVIGAIAQDDVKRILSFHIISQIGYMIMGLGLFTVAGVAGAVFYVLHQIPGKTVLFLVGGLVEHTTGTGILSRVGGLLRRAPVIAVAFLIPALSLGGIPPFAGFIAKLSLVVAGLEREAWIIVAVALFASILTMVSMTKIWAGVFWGEPDETPPIPGAMEADRLRAPVLMTGATLATVGITLAIAVFAGPIFDMAERAATDLLDGTAYARAVMSP
jgi:multicomponent Na+:H+ antiporter subunit D